LGPAQLAAAASVGSAKVTVFARPRVGVLATGDELVPIDQVPGPAQIRNSNSLMLVSLLERLGCDVTDLGVVRDEPERVRDALGDGLRFDVLFVTGGMSMGAHDYVPRTLLDLGADLRITKLRIKPGKPFVFGVKGDRFVFGLPGNPVSGFVCTVRLAARLLARMRGADPEPAWRSAVLQKPLPANGPREFYQPAVLHNGQVTPLEWKGSADVYTLAAANGLLVRGESEPALPAGNTVRVLELPT
ncbi:MAG TPA: molybdopterin molybdotransferase MoeA, partial [Blastocatellia bacterium]|nr:molybdopterin molybdotransferase MoeA [Blastocatellia bacterium]